MTIHTITLEEKEVLTGQAANLFKMRNPEFYPCAANSEKLVSFIESQLGMPIITFPYPVSVEQFQAAYEHIKATSWFYARPEEEPEQEDPAVTRERLAQQKVRDDFDARQRAAQTERDRNLPLKELRRIVSVQNKDFRAQREQNLLPIRATGLESRHVEQVRLGIPAQARVNVGLAHPELSPKSGEFSKLCAAEVVRLRSQQ